MQNELPYLPSYKNVDALFTKIASAKIPEAFTHKFLYDTIGLKGPGDRPLITLLKTLGFLDSAGKPTNAYSSLKNPTLSPYAIATAIKKAYEPLFAANENAHKLGSEQLKGLIAQVAGSDEGTTQKIAGTYNSLLKLANFDKLHEEGPKDGKSIKDDDKHVEEEEPTYKAKGLRPDFHYNIQIHLPNNATEETYLNIFNSIRKTFQ